VDMVIKVNEWQFFAKWAIAKVVELWWNNLSWKMALLRCLLILPLPYSSGNPIVESRRSVFPCFRKSPNQDEFLCM
jgi:hypothetical protein